MSPVVIYMPICVVRAFVPLSSCNINHVCPPLLTADRGGIQLARDMMGGGVETNHSLVDAITNCPEMQTVPHKAPQLRFPRKTVLACETLFEVHTPACSEGERKKKKRLVVGGQVQEVRAPFASEIQETAFLRNALQGSSLVDNPERTRLRFQDLRREASASAPTRGGGGGDKPRKAMTRKRRQREMCTAHVVCWAPAGRSKVGERGSNDQRTCTKEERNKRS